MTTTEARKLATVALTYLVQALDLPTNKWHTVHEAPCVTEAEDFVFDGTFPGPVRVIRVTAVVVEEYL